MIVKQKIRFAALVRVSTERQADKGESLNSQSSQITQWVADQGGVIPDGCWYRGQEHGTPGHEREIFDALLHDAIAGVFDAVIVVDPSRWSRDNRRSKDGLEILRQQGVRFFTGPMEQDLNLPEVRFQIGLYTEMNEYIASTNARKSTQSRIERAKRGWFAAGSHRPYGRRITNETKNREGMAQWEVIPEDQKRVREMHRLYVEDGYSFEKIGQLKGMSGITVRSRLMLRCGPKLVQQFKLDGKEIKVEIDIPPLLTDQEIELVRRQAKKNQMFRGTTEVYPLAHMVRCNNCGSVLSGVTIHRKRGKTWRYRHYDKSKRCGCVLSVNAEQLECAVFSQIGQILADQDALAEAIKRAVVGNQENKQHVEKQIKSVAKAIMREDKALDRIVDAIADASSGKSSTFGGKLQQKASDIEGQLTVLKAQRQKLVAQYANMTTDIPSDLQLKVRQMLSGLIGLNGNAPAAWPREAKKLLAEFFFGKNDKRYGVILSKETHPDLGDYWSYEIRGRIGMAAGVLSDYVYLHDRYTEEQATAQVDGKGLERLVRDVAEFNLPRDPHIVGKVSYPIPISL